MAREALLIDTLVTLAGSLTSDFDVVEVLTLMSDRCVEVLDVAAAGVLLVTDAGDLRTVASSSETMHLLDLLEVESDEGPCPECYRRGEAILNVQLDETGGRWPDFGPKAFDAGFRSVHALPLQFRGQTIGALNLFAVDVRPLPEADVIVAQSFADVATVAVLQNRAAVEAGRLNDQLAYALNSRIAIEQAKGVVAEAAGIEIPDAFRRLREHARAHNLRLVDVARAVATRALAVDDLDPI